MRRDDFKGKNRSPASWLPPLGEDRITLTGPEERFADLRDVAPCDLGQMLKAAVASRTQSINLVVGYFAHTDFPNADNDTDAVVRAELEEFINEEDNAEERTSSISLAFGEVMSPEGCLALRAWWALCRWHVAHPIVANRWRRDLLDRLKRRKIGVDTWLAPLVDGCVERDAFSAWLARDGREVAVLLREPCPRKLDEDSKRCVCRLVTLFCLRQADVRWGAPLAGACGIFHPKIYVIERNAEAEPDTVVIMGSGNWSSSAFTQDRNRGNIEIGVAHRGGGHLWTDATPRGATSAQLAWIARGIFSKAEPLASWASPFAAEARRLIDATEVDQRRFAASFDPCRSRETVEVHVENLEPPAAQGLEPEDLERHLERRGWAIAEDEGVATTGGAFARRAVAEFAFVLYLDGRPIGAIRVRHSDETDGYEESFLFYLEGAKLRFAYRLSSRALRFADCGQVRVRPAVVSAIHTPNELRALQNTALPEEEGDEP